MDHVSLLLLWLDPPISLLSTPSTLSSHTLTVRSMGVWSHSMLMILPWSRWEKHIRYKWHLKSIDKSGRGGRGHRKRLLFVCENPNWKNISHPKFEIESNSSWGPIWIVSSPCKESFSEWTICHKLEQRYHHQDFLNAVLMERDAIQSITFLLLFTSFSDPSLPHSVRVDGWMVAWRQKQADRLLNCMAGCITSNISEHLHSGIPSKTWVFSVMSREMCTHRRTH